MLLKSLALYSLVLGILSSSPCNQLTRVPVASAKVEQLITAFDEEGLERLVTTLPTGSERDLAAGVVASRTGHLATGDALLQRVMQAKPARVPRQAIAQEYLALNAALRSDYAHAATHGRALLAAGSTALRGNDLADFQQQVETWEVLKQAPPQVVNSPGPATLPLVATKTGRLEAAVLVNGVAAVGLFDTGATMSVMSQRLAQQLHLVPLPGQVHDTGSGGITSAVQLALLDQLTLGAASLRHVPVKIFADSALLIGAPGKQSQLDFIVGYPVLRALGTFTLARSGKLLFGAAAGPAQVTGRLIERGPTGILLAQIAGKPANFLVDTGADISLLTSAFYQHHTQGYTQDKASNQRFGGIGGNTQVQHYTLPSLQLTLQKGNVALQRVSVFPRPSALDVQGLVGLIGRDLGATFDELTLDFTRGQLCLK